MMCDGPVRVSWTIGAYSSCVYPSIYGHALLKVSPFHFRLVFGVMDLYLGLFGLFLTRTCEVESSIDDGIPQKYHLGGPCFHLWICLQNQAHNIHELLMF